MINNIAKGIVKISLIVCLATSISGCAELSEDVAGQDYVVDPNDYDSMRSGGEYYDPASTDLQQNGNMDPVKSKADSKNKSQVESEQAAEESKKAAEHASIAAEESKKAAESIAASKESSQTGGGTSSDSGISGDFKGSNNSGDKNMAGAGNMRDKNLGEVITIIRGDNSNSNNSSHSSSGGSTNKDIARKNVASIKKSGKLYDSYITVESCYRGSQALRRVNTYNSHHAVEYDMNIPNGYELCVVTFTVEPSSSLGSSSSGVYIPKTIIRQGSGSSFGDYSILGQVLQLSLDDYDSEDNDKNNNNLTYDLVFEIPESTEGYSVIFGESTGSTYRFKSSSLD